VFFFFFLGIVGVADQFMTMKQTSMEQHNSQIFRNYKG